MTEDGDEDSLSLSTLFPTDGGERFPALSQGEEDGLPSLVTLVEGADPAVLMGAAAVDDDRDSFEAFFASFEGVDPPSAVPPMGDRLDDIPATGYLWLAAEAAAASVAGGAVPEELQTPLPVGDHDGLGGGGGGWPASAPPSALLTVEGDDGMANGAAALSPVSTVAPDVIVAAEPAPPNPSLAPYAPVTSAPPAPVAAAITVPPGASSTSLASDSSRVTGAPAARAAAVAAAARAYLPAAAGPSSTGSAATAEPWAAVVDPASTAALPTRGLSAVERAQQKAENIAVAEVATRRANAAKAKRARSGSGAGGPAKKRARGAGAVSDAAAEDDADGGEEEAAEAGEAAADANVAGSDAEKSRRYQKRLQKNRDSAFVSRIRRRHYTSILEASLKKEEEEKRALGGEVAQLRSQLETLKAQLVAYRAPAARTDAFCVPSSVVPSSVPALPAGEPPASGSASSTGRCPLSSSAAAATLPAPLGGRSSPVSSSMSDPPAPYRLPGPTIRTRLGATVSSRNAARPAMVTTLLVAAVILGFCVPVAFLPEIASVAAVWATRPLARWVTSDAAVAAAAAGLFDNRPARTSPPRGLVAHALPWPKQEQCIPSEEPALSLLVASTPSTADDVDDSGLAGDSDAPPVVPADSDSERCMVSADAFFDHIFIRDEREATSSSSSATAATTGRGGSGGGSSAGPLLRPPPALSPTSPPRPPVASLAPSTEPPVWAPQPTALSLSLWAKDRGRGSRIAPVGSSVPAPLPAPLPRPPPPPATMPQLLGGGGGGCDGGGASMSAPRPRVRAWSANASDGAAAAASSPPLLGVGGRVWAAAARPAGWMVDAGATTDGAVLADTAAPLPRLCEELASLVDTSVGGWPASGSAEMASLESAGRHRAVVTASSGTSASSSRGSSHTRLAATSPLSSHVRSAYKGKAPALPRSALSLPPPHIGGGSHGGGDVDGATRPPPPAILSPAAAAVASRPWRAARPWAAAAADAAAAAPAAGGRLWREVAAWATARVEAALAPGGSLARALTAATAPEERVLGDVVHLMLLTAYADGAARAKAPAAFAA